MARKRTDPTAWRDTPAGDATWRAARAEAQRKANETGYDHGVEANDLFKSFAVFMLPTKSSRCGHELRCEVVSCEQIDRCQKGHGPCAEDRLAQNEYNARQETLIRQTLADDY